MTALIRTYVFDAALPPDRIIRNSEQLMADEFVCYQLWMATDIIGDVDWALSSYLDHDFPEDIGERYLKVYGAMQALYIQ